MADDEDRLENPTIQHVREELQCAVCCELFSEPKTLSCLHTFCSKCLEASEVARRRGRGRQDKEDVVECPFCRSAYTYSGGLSGIITNFVYQNIVEHLRVHKQIASESSGGLHMCGKCQHKEDESPKVAVSYCYDCQAFLCEFCERMHKQTVDLAHHHVCSLEEIRQNKVPVIMSRPHSDDSRYICNRHKDPFKLYCYTCKEVICRDCVVMKEDHRDHKYKFISEIITKERADMLKYMEPLRAIKEHFTQCSNSILEHQEELDRRQDRRSMRINRAVDEALQLFEERRQQLHGEARQVCEVKKKNITLQLEEIEIMKSSVDSTSEFTQTTIEKGSDTEVMIYKKEIIARIETLKKKYETYKAFNVGDADAVDFMHDLQPIREFGRLCEVPHFETSTAAGEGLKAPMQDEVTTFVVQAKDEKGEPLLHGGGSCFVKITTTPVILGREQVVPNTVTDNCDGTYTVSYRPPHPGVNRISVGFDEKELKESPYKLNVKRNFLRPIGEPRIYQLPNASPWGVAMISDSEIAVTASDSIVRVYDIDGRQISQIRSEFTRPYGISTDYQNHVWVTDREAHTVQKYARNSDGTFRKLFHFGGRGCEAGKFSHPRGVAVSSVNGFIYISDMKNNRIQIFKPGNPLPRYQGSFGAPGKEPGKFNLPAGICFNRAGNLVICDDHNCRLQEFSPDGKLVRTLGTTNTEKGLLCSPIGITTDFHGRYIITEFGSHCVTFLSPEGDVLNCIKAVGKGYGQFVHPRGITCDSSGYIYVADNENMRIARF